MTLYDKLIKIIFLILLSICIVIPQSLALNTYIYEINDPRQEKLWINDMANLIEPEIENEINQILTEVNLKYRSEIVILTVPDIVPYESPQQLAKYIFNIWHITKIGFTDGALFLVSQNDHRGEIIAGFVKHPSEPSYEEKKFQENVRKIIATEVSNLFFQDQYGEGILLGTEKLIALIKQKKLNECKSIPKIKFFSHLYDCTLLDD